MPAINLLCLLVVGVIVATLASVAVKAGSLLGVKTRLSGIVSSLRSFLSR